MSLRQIFVLLSGAALVAPTFAATTPLKHRRRQDDQAVNVLEVAAGTLDGLAEELFLDFGCLSDANQRKTLLAESELINIPWHCCGTSCYGAFCCLRDECDGQTTADAPTVSISSTASCIVTNTVPPTSAPATLASTSVTLITASSKTFALDTSSLSTAQDGPATSSAGSLQSTNSDPSQNLRPTASSLITTTTTDPNGSTLTLTMLPSTGSDPAAGQTTNVNSNPATKSGSTVTTITSDGNTMTSTLLSGSETPPFPATNSTNAGGNQGTGTTATDSSTPPTLTTIIESGSTIVSTLIPTSALPSGSSLVSSGAATSPSLSTITTVDASGNTIVSISTLPSGTRSSAIGTVTDVSGSLVTSTLSSAQPTTATTASSLITQTLTDLDGSFVTLNVPSDSSITGLETITTSGSTLTVQPVPSTSNIPTTSNIPPPGSLNDEAQILTQPDGSTITLQLPSGSAITTIQTITTSGSVLTIGPVSTDLGLTTSSNSDVAPMTSLATIPTSTQTTAPPSFSIQAFTESSISGNTWITTTGSDSSTTILPIILPCETCQPEIVWNVPGVPNVEFDFPGFPSMSSFSLPCIKVFGVHVAGECPDGSSPPPVNIAPPESPEPNTQLDPDQPQPTETEPDPNPTETATTQNSDKPSSTASTSTESCTASTTITDFFVSCTSSPGASTPSCSITSSQVSTGCSLTPTTTTTASACSLVARTAGVKTAETVTLSASTTSSQATATTSSQATTATSSASGTENSSAASISTIAPPGPSGSVSADQPYIYIQPITTCAGESDTEDCTDQWIAYQYAPGAGDDLDICGEDDWWYGPEGPPSFPVQLGPFDLNTFSDCSMSLQNVTDGGIITCGNIQTSCRYVAAGDGESTTDCDDGGTISSTGNSVCIFAGIDGN